MVIRHIRVKDPAGPQHSPDLGQVQPGIGQVLEYLLGTDDVKVGIGEKLVGQLRDGNWSDAPPAPSSAHSPSSTPCASHPRRAAASMK